jgi:hypothetical protein
MHHVTAPQVEDLVGSILEETIPMYGRMIHGRDSKGELYGEGQAYDIGGRVGTHLLTKSAEQTDVQTVYPGCGSC